MKGSWFLSTGAVFIVGGLWYTLTLQLYISDKIDYCKSSQTKDKTKLNHLNQIKLNKNSFETSFKPIWQFVYKKTEEWYIEWQRVPTNDNEWQRVVQRVKTSNTTKDNEWQRITTSGNEWQQARTSGHFN